MSKSNTSITGVQVGILAVLLIAFSPAALIVLKTAGLGHAVSVLLTIIFSFLFVLYSRNRLPSQLYSNENKHRFVFVFWLLFCAFAGFRLISMSVFMYNVDQTEYAYAPHIREFNNEDMAKPFFLKHNCFTCYMVAAHLLTSDVDNIYDKKHYRGEEANSPIHKAAEGKLTIDQYQYPPPFLLLPRALMATGGDFLSWRAYWFALNILVITFTIWGLARWVGGDCFHSTWFIWPALFVAPTTLGALQIENVHLLVVTSCVAAMLLFENKRNMFGGVVLGYLVVSKIFPGVLLAYLLVRRKWKPFIWTSVSMVGCTLAAILWFGLQPFESFVSYQLPRIASGEAFWFAFEMLRPKMLNGSIMGIPYKLEELGLLSNAAMIAKVLMWLFTGLILFVLFLLRSRPGENSDVDAVSDNLPQRRLWLAKIWMVLIILGQMRSPFLPWGYGNFAILWFAVLLIPNPDYRWWKMLRLVVFWVLFAMMLPLPFGPTHVTYDFIWSLLAMSAVLSVCTVTIVRQVRASTTQVNE